MRTVVATRRSKQGACLQACVHPAPGLPRSFAAFIKAARPRQDHSELIQHAFSNWVVGTQCNYALAHMFKTSGLQTISFSSLEHNAIMPWHLCSTFFANCTVLTRNSEVQNSYTGTQASSILVSAMYAKRSSAPSIPPAPATLERVTDTSVRSRG